MNIEISENEFDLICSALYEFVYASGRHDVKSYVDKRYPAGYAPESLRKSKLFSVAERVKLAEDLRFKLLRS